LGKPTEAGRGPGYMEKVKTATEKREQDADTQEGRRENRGKGSRVTGTVKGCRGEKVWNQISPPQGTSEVGPSWPRPD